MTEKSAVENLFRKIQTSLPGIAGVCHGASEFVLDWT